MFYSYLLFLSLYLINATNAQYNLGNGKAVGAGLWFYKYTDVASECTNFLGPNGYSYVQVAPIQSSLKRPFPADPSRSFAWWNVYQPLSYNINSRFGTTAEFQSMVTSCRNAGVDVVVDVVLNHGPTINENGVGGFGSTTAWSTTAFAESLPDFGYTANDFNDGACNGNINDYNNNYEVVNCRLGALSDLKTSSTVVRNKIATFLNQLISYGVAGFRTDAAKHLSVADWNNIINQLSNTYRGIRPFFTHELYSFNDGYRNYQTIGTCSNFEYNKGIGQAFRNLAGKTTDQVANYLNPNGWLQGEASSVFIENHDMLRNQEGNADYALSRLNNGWNYKQAVAFSILYPWGVPMVHSDYNIQYVTGTNSDEIPNHPNQDANGMILPMGTITNNVCSNGWTCQHRWSDVFPLVRVRNFLGAGLNRLPQIKNYGVGSNQLWFSVINKAFVAINSLQGAQNPKNMGGNIQTGLPAGTYCNMVYGYASSGNCVLWPGVVLNNAEQTSYVVNNFGVTTVNIKDADKSRVLALYRQPDGLRSSPSQTSVTFQVTHNTGMGDNLYIVGNFQGWDTCNSIPCTWSTGNVWTCPRLSTTGIAYEWKPIKYGTASGTGCGNPIWYSGANRVYTATGANQVVSFSY